MRCFQFMGLSKEALIWLNKNCAMVPDQVCPYCMHTISWKREILSEKLVDSFYGVGPTLHVYRLKDGSIVKEIIQAEPWSSGPVCFLYLELEDGTKIGEWDEEKIDHC